MINFINKDLITDIDEGDVVLVPMSINQAMNNGFAYDVSLNFPSVKAKECLSNYGDKRKYGKINVIESDGITFIMCYIHTGGYRKSEPVFVDYGYLKSCLKQVSTLYDKIKTPLLGSTIFDGNGDKDIIKGIFDELKNEKCIFNVYLYEQKDTKLMFHHKRCELYSKYNNKEIDYETFKKEKEKISWQSKHGILKEYK